MGALNVQPFISACLDLHSVLGSRQTLLPRQDFMAAARSVETSLAPEYVPGFPENRRREIRSLFENAEKIEGLPEGRISLIFAVAVVEALKNMGLFPDIETLRNPRAIEDLFLKFIRNNISPLDTLQEGAIRALDPDRRTLHYQFDRMAEGALQAVAEAISNSSIVVVDSTDIIGGPTPLIDPVEGRLLIEGGIYLPKQGKIVASINPSSYRLGPEIAKGGNSIVHIGEEIGTKRKVAIKIVTVKDESQRGELLERFKKEIEYQATFQSERFVRVYATGMTSQGDPFIVMEYCERGALSDLIRSLNEDTAFDMKRALKIAYQLVDAVAEAHAGGIVHRDIKPHNFFVTSAGDVKLGDCGLAERIDLLPNHPTPNEIVGTPAYIPPETARDGFAGGKAGDVWALGVTLYELFTGVFCFPGPDAVAMMTASIVKKPISPALLRTDRKIPKVIDGIIMKCLQKDAVERYGDARALLYDLLTADARALIDEAQEALNRVTQSRVDDKKHEEEWRTLLQDALRELRKAYDQFPHPEILLKRAELNFTLYEWAKKRGDEELLERTKESLEALRGPALEAAPDDVRKKIEGYWNETNRKQRFHLTASGRQATSGFASKMKIEVGRHDYRAKFLEFDKIVARQTGLPQNALSMERGLRSLRISAPGYVPLNLPLPVRAGDYEIQIPLYRRDEVPDQRAVIVPAGPVAARTQDGSFSELLDASSWRVTSHDVAFLPLRTNQDWWDHLQDVRSKSGTEAVLERLPKNWVFDESRRIFLYADSGEDILWDAPVTHVLPEHAEEYLTALSERFGPSFKGRVRHPKLNEWKRAMRGNDARMWPWGDALPMPGIVCFRFPNHDNAPNRAVIPAPRSPLLDISPFSYPEVGRVLAHVASNVQKFLDVSDEDERRRIAAAFNRKDAERFYGQNVIVAGTTYRSPATTNPDILDYRGRHEVGDCGIMPVIQLHASDPMPTLESLHQ